MLYYARAVDWPETRKKRAEDLREGSRAAVKAAIKAGVRIALGTDAGGGAARHGRIAREAELMVECGMEPRDALIAATSSELDCGRVSRRKARRIDRLGHKRNPAVLYRQL